MKISLMLFYICFLMIICSELMSAQNREFCSKIYGKWKVYKVQHPFGIQQDNKDLLWTFDKNDTVTINGILSIYKLSEDCLNIKIGNMYNYSILHLDTDSLILQKKILPHENYNLYFIKND